MVSHPGHQDREIRRAWPLLLQHHYQRFDHDTHLGREGERDGGGERERGGKGREEGRELYMYIQP